MSRIDAQTFNYQAECLADVVISGSGLFLIGVFLGVFGSFLLAFLWVTARDFYGDGLFRVRAYRAHLRRVRAGRELRGQ